MRLTEVVLFGIVSILGSPDWENACEAEVLEMYRFNPAGLEARIKLLTKKYALRDEPDKNPDMKEMYEKLSKAI